MDITPAQNALAAAGLYAGMIDNLMGPLTMKGLMMSGANVEQPSAVMEAIAPAIVASLSVAALTTPLRLCHYLAQCTVETANWETLVEYGDDAYFVEHYDPGTEAGKDVGNTQPGDGPLFRGRGPLQTTGRYNYGKASAWLGTNLIAHPQLLATDMTLSAASAAHFWLNCGANVAADADDAERVTRLVNGGENALAAREAALTRLKTLWGL